MEPAIRRPRSCLAALLIVALLSASGHCFAQRVRTGKVAELYQELCANCHGKNLEGGQAQSMLDDVWLGGGDDESLARSIRNGYPDREMPAWGSTIPEKEIRAMVIYIREQRAKFEREQTKFAEPEESISVQSDLHSYQLNTWVNNLEEPYSLAFLPGNRAIFTEKKGRIQLLEDGKLVGAPITGLPPLDTSGQAGLYDVVPHPDHARNGWLYFAYADMRKNGEGKDVSLTSIIRGRIRDGALVDQQTIYRAPLAAYPPAGRVHFGGRIAFDRAGYLYFTIGERGTGSRAQDLAVPMGKVHRIHDDGRIPSDNPFVRQPNAVPSIWSYGHRNPQGLAFHPVTDQLFDAEHGPRGGDELNLVQRGRNYGWPVITFGMNYDGTTMTEFTAKEGMEQPVTYWTPSIAVCGINFYSGTLFPKWRHHLFVTSLAAEELRRIELRDGRLVAEEVLFKNLGRIRHVIGGPDGAIYVLLPKRIARLAPAR